MGVGPVEEVLRGGHAATSGALGGTDAAREQPHVDAAGVHGGEERRQWAGLGGLVAEQLVHPGDLGLRREAGGEPFGEDVHPRIEDHAVRVPDARVRNREYDRCMDSLGFRPFDADNHYYEATDAFTRHIDPTHGQAVRCSGPRSTARQRLLVGGQVNRFIPNPTFDPIAEARLPRRRTSAAATPPASTSRRCSASSSRSRAPGVPRPRRPACGSSTSRASRARSSSRRSASAWRRRLRARLPTRCTPRSTRSTAGSTTTGASTWRRPPLRRALPHASPTPSWRRRRGRPGARLRCPHPGRRARPGALGRRLRVARPTRSSTRSGRA